MGWDAVGIMEAFDDAKIQIFLCLKKYFLQCGEIFVLLQPENT